jgi:hypothetical protein
MNLLVFPKAVSDIIVGYISDFDIVYNNGDIVGYTNEFIVLYQKKI